MALHQPLRQRVQPLIPVFRQVQLQLPTIDWSTRSRRFMNMDELEVLCGLVSMVQAKTVVEFGVNVGRTAQALLEYVPGIQKYVGVDVPFGYVTPKEVQRKEVPEQPGCLVQDDSRFQLLLPAGGSRNLSAMELPQDCDAIFIDGDHSREGVLNDTMLALQIVSAGGIIIWHDYHNQGTVDVKPVLDAKFREGWPLQHVENTWFVFMRV